MANPLDISFPNQGESPEDIFKSGTITTQNLVPLGAATEGSAVEMNASGIDTLSIQTTGTYTGALTPQATIDGTNWITLTGTPLLRSTGAYSATIASATQDIFTVDVSGFQKFRLTALAAVTGTVNVSFNGSVGNSSVSISSALPAGTNAIGSLTGVIPGVAATSLGKAEDAVAATGDTGIANLGVRVPVTPAAQTSAAGDYGMLAVDAEGKLVASQYSATEHYWQSAVLTLTNTTSTALKTAAAAGVRNYLTDIDIANTSATGVRVDILDGSTVVASFWAPPTSHVQHSYSIPKKGTAATALNAQLSAAVTDVRVSASGYIGV